MNIYYTRAGEGTRGRKGERAQMSKQGKGAGEGENSVPQGPARDTAGEARGKPGARGHDEGKQVKTKERQ